MEPLVCKRKTKFWVLGVGGFQRFSNNFSCPKINVWCDIHLNKFNGLEGRAKGLPKTLLFICLYIQYNTCKGELVPF